MARFTYTKDPDLKRDSFFDPIIHSAHIQVLSAKTNEEGNREYVVMLSDISQNLPQSVIFSFIFDTRQRQVIHVEKTTTPVISGSLQDVTMDVPQALGNDLDELCYGIEIQDQQMGISEEFDLLIRASGELDYTDFDDDSSVQIEKTGQEG